VEAGYQPEMAYFEVLHELKLIVDMINESGISGMRFSISETAKYGDIIVGPKVVDASVKKRMKSALKDIQTGKFAKDWIAEAKTGKKKYTALLKAGEKHPIEKVGQQLRSRMSWVKKKTSRGPRPPTEFFPRRFAMKNARGDPGVFLLRVIHLNRLDEARVLLRTKSTMINEIKNLLGADADSLLNHTCKTVSKDLLHLPGPDFVDRIFIESDRNPRVLANLQRMYGTGRLANTGYLSILPVDQGIEHSAGASFAKNPIYFDPENIVKLAIEGGCNAVASTFGVLGSVARKYAHRIPSW